MKKALSICLVCALLLQSFVGVPTALAENTNAAITQQVSENDKVLEGWTAMHPGAGGSVQSITYHEGVPGRMYFCSDMEGSYLSNDYGKTWEWMAMDINHSMNLNIVGEPYNKNQLYLGTIYGMSVSSDGGKSWDYIMVKILMEQKMLFRIQER